MQWRVIEMNCHNLPDSHKLHIVNLLVWKVDHLTKLVFTINEYTSTVYPRFCLQSNLLKIAGSRFDKDLSIKLYR